MQHIGAVAKRLCTGLQIRVGRFDSGPRLQSKRIIVHSVVRFFCMHIGTLVAHI